jgi:DNA topoisomerase-1
MADAITEKTVATVGISTQKDTLKAEGEVIKFDGFLKIYTEDKDEESEDDTQDGMLPPLAVGQQVALRDMKATERFARAQPRYTEASLVKKLEELGIGRPSTYAPTISTIQKRGYVERKDKEGVQRAFKIISLTDNTVTKQTSYENTGAEKSKMFPTDLGLVVTDFLKQHFTDIMDYGFTAKIENEFDEVANGNTVWHKMIDNFYHPFHKDIEETIETAQRQSGERELGIDPVTGKKIVARMGRFGPMVQLGDNSNEDDPPKYARLKANQSIETISFEEALDLFKLPLHLGTFNNEEIQVNVGRFGPYVKYGEQFISIPRGEEPLEITLDRAIQIIEAKQKEDAPIAIVKGLAVIKGKGRFGPFIKWNNLFINIPKAFDFDNLTQQDCEELIAKKEEKEAGRYIQLFDGEKFHIENGRWGPFIKFGKKMIKIPPKQDGTKYSAEELSVIDVGIIKDMITAADPTAFAVSAKKKAAPKKSSTKKAPTKKAAVKKVVAKKK